MQKLSAGTNQKLRKVKERVAKKMAKQPKK